MIITSEIKKKWAKYYQIYKKLVKLQFFVEFSLMVRFLEISQRTDSVKASRIAAIVVIIAVIAIVSAVALTYEEPNSAEVEDTLGREVSPEETLEAQQKMLEIETKKLENMDELLASDYDPDRPRPWPTSGPFQIDRPFYYLGEKVFLRIGGLDYNEKGEIAFMRPLNATNYSVYMTIPFDGADKNAFNYYISPQLTKARGICSAEDIVGEWQVVFRGTNYPNLKFNYINQTIPGDEDNYLEPVC